MSETSTLIGYGGRTIGREELTLVPTPPATETHRPIPHHEIVQALVETLGFRHIGVVHDEYAVSPDGMKVFGVLDLETEMEGCRFSIGLRNSHDKSMRLAMTCGYRVFVCSNMAFAGDFTPVLAKHSKSFSLVDCISVGVDRMQRSFEPMRKQVEAWQRSELTDVTAKVVIYEAFVEGELEAPKHLARTVHDLYFARPAAATGTRFQDRWSSSCRWPSSLFLTGLWTQPVNAQLGAGFITIDPPQSGFTTAYGINDHRKIVGTCNCTKKCR
jgi:hypothetical protein